MYVRLLGGISVHELLKSTFQISLISANNFRKIHFLIRESSCSREFVQVFGKAFTIAFTNDINVKNVDLSDLHNCKGQGSIHSHLYPIKISRRRSYDIYQLVIYMT